MTIQSYGKSSKHHQRALEFNEGLVKEILDLDLIALKMPAEYLPKHHAFVWEKELPYWKPISSVCPKLITSKEPHGDPKEGEIGMGFYHLTASKPEDHNISIFVFGEGEDVVSWASYMHEMAHALAPPLTDYDALMHHGHTPAWLQSFVRLLQRFCQYNPKYPKDEARQMLKNLIYKHLKKNNLERAFTPALGYKI